VNDMRWTNALYGEPWVERATIKDIDPARLL